jgi:hypothetical protein
MYSGCNTRSRKSINLNELEKAEPRLADEAVCTQAVIQGAGRV